MSSAKIRVTTVMKGDCKDCPHMTKRMRSGTVDIVWCNNENMVKYFLCPMGVMD